MSIGNRIAEARQKAGLSQSELARQLGIRPQSVQAWESGQTAPRARRIAEVAEVLGVPEVFFFEVSEKRATGGDQEERGNVQPAQRLAERVVRLADSGLLGERDIKVLGELVELLADRERDR